MTDDRSTRRRVLAASGTILSSIATAGCLGGIGNSDGDGGGSGTATTITVNEDTTTTTATTEATDTTTDTTTEETTNEDGENTTTTEDRPANVSFEAPHGETILATLYGEGDCGIVLVPQINLDRESWAGEAKRLADQNHLVLAIDEDPDNRSASVRGAITFLREQQEVSSIVLIGASSGGEAVVVANANAPDGAVDGTIAISPGGGADHASELQGRTLFVVSENDDDRFVRVANELHEGAPEPTALVTYEGAAHGQRIFESDHGDDLRGRITAFVEAVCGD